MQITSCRMYVRQEVIFFDKRLTRYKIIGKIFIYIYICTKKQRQKL